VWAGWGPNVHRRKVDQMTGGRVAHVYLPDTAFGGFTNFTRYFFQFSNSPTHQLLCSCVACLPESLEGTSIH
jgi:hypothetical protein